jgi:F420H(2)-dependent quinone reductase
VVVLPLLRLHNALYQRTNGRIGHHLPGMPPSLILHTTGAKTGALCSNTLTYARDDQDFLVVASMGGAPTSPGWYHNLKNTPQVEINVGTKRITATAHPVLPDDPDYKRLWRVVNENNSKSIRGLPTAHHPTHPRSAPDTGLGDSPRDGELVNTVDRPVLLEAKVLNPDVQTQRR